GRDRELEVGDRIAAWMPDLLELLVGKLRLERLHEARGGLAGGVGDDVELDGHVSRLMASEAPTRLPSEMTGRQSRNCHQRLKEFLAHLSFALTDSGHPRSMGQRRFRLLFAMAAAAGLMALAFTGAAGAAQSCRAHVLDGCRGGPHDRTFPVEFDPPTVVTPPARHTV